MEILRTPQEMQAWSSLVHQRGRSIGFVPTMGALHLGHTTLLDTSTSENDSTVLSIFVNPTQFNVTADFEKYPRSFDSDCNLGKQHGVDVVYAPSVEVMYPEGSSVVVTPGSAAFGMEGEMRPGHFQGVTTVVAKLFHAVQPHRAYFGKKDFQQLAVIRQMVRDLDFPISIVAVDTIRESDGLAMSSRNVRLAPHLRSQAHLISKGLLAARHEHALSKTESLHLTTTITRVINDAPDARIEYVQVCNPQTLEPVSSSDNGAVICVAVWFDDVRLIDNIELPKI